MGWALGASVAGVLLGYLAARLLSGPSPRGW